MIRASLPFGTKAMRHRLFAAPLLLPAALLASASAHAAPAIEAASAPPLRGRVTGPQGDGISGALVVAYDLGRLASFPALTGATGLFDLPSLPAGLYRIVALKKGFAPLAIRMVHAAGAGPVQLPLRASGESATAPASGAKPLTREEIWSLRERLPPDVLRDLEVPDDAPVTVASGDPAPSGARAFSASLSAMTGSSATSTGAEPTALSQTRVGLSGGLPGGGRWKVAAGYGRRATETLGADADLSLDVETSRRSQISWKSRRAELDGLSPEGDQIDSHTVSWKAPGERGTTTLTARVLEESRDRGGRASLASRLVEVNGGWNGTATGGIDLDAGFRLRQEESSSIFGDATAVPARALDLGGGGRLAVGERWSFGGGASASLADGRFDASPHLSVNRNFGSAELRIDGRGRIRGFREEQPVRSSLLGFLDETEELERSERWSVGFTFADASAAELDAPTHYEVELRIRTLDRPARLFLDNGLAGALDELTLPSGTEIREARVRASRRVDRLQGEVGASLRDASFADDTERARIGEVTVAAIWLPTGTELRYGEQMRDRTGLRPTALRRSQLRLGQRLPLPAAWPTEVKLLVQGELARGDRHSFGLDGDGDLSDRRWLGGLAFEF